VLNNERFKTVLQEKQAETIKQNNEEKRKKPMCPRKRKARHSISTALLQSVTCGAKLSRTWQNTYEYITTI
jgi:hypothetical protein